MEERSSEAAAPWMELVGRYHALSVAVGISQTRFLKRLMPMIVAVPMPVIVYVPPSALHVVPSKYWRTSAPFTAMMKLPAAVVTFTYWKRALVSPLTAADPTAPGLETS